MFRAALFGIGTREDATGLMAIPKRTLMGGMTMGLAIHMLMIGADLRMVRRLIKIEVLVGPCRPLIQHRRFPSRNL